MSETIIDASPSAHGYLVSPLTDHISETDEGYLVVTGCPIARTGFQEYSVKDLNQDAARELGIDVSRPGAAIDLYRPASEVFAPEFLASLNGKSITDNHPPQFLNKDNQREFSMGHIQNPRKGDEPLENGEWPLVADLVITAEPLISKVRNKEQREVSLGYDYGIRRDGDKVVQCDMLGNHVAIVPKGRAGDLVSIQDAAPEDVATFGKVVQQLSSLTTALKSAVDARAAPIRTAATTRASPPAVAAKVAPRDSNATSTATKEKKPVKITWKGLVGRGLRALAQDADVPDEDIAQAALEATEDRHMDDRHMDDRHMDDRHMDDRRARDRRRGRDDDPAITAPEDYDRETEDRRARDRHMDDRRARDRHMDDRRARDRKRGRDYDDPTLDEPEDFDREPADDKRRKMHDALDRMLDRHGEDADLEALKDLLDDYFTEEEEEPEHSEDRRTDDEETEGSPDLGELERVVGETTEDDEAAPGEEVVESGEAEPEPGEDRHTDDRIAEEDAEEEGEADDCAACGAPMEADDAFCSSCGAEADDRKRGRDRRRGKDRAKAADGAMAVLKVLRPYAAARDANPRFKAAFNAALAATTRGSRATSSSYGGFAGAARARDRAPRKPQNRAQAADGAVDRNSKLQAAYDAALKGGR